MARRERRWRRLHPDQAPEYAAKRAVAVILAHNIELKIDEWPP